MEDSIQRCDRLRHSRTQRGIAGGEGIMCCKMPGHGVLYPRNGFLDPSCRAGCCVIHEQPNSSVARSDKPLGRV